ncbi:hypothetical protein DYB32_006507 [Aphanomyces invadans]|nr:hypothetical protein DYB32_006507 [Aphanomyces invadans]
MTIAPSTETNLVDAFLQEIHDSLHGGLGATASTPAVSAAPTFVHSTADVPPPSAAVPPSPIAPIENALDEPSRSVVLRGVLDEVDDPSDNTTSSDEYLDVEEDLRIECSNFGTVVQVSIRRELNEVAVEFDALDSAIACLKAMHGRWFGGRQIRATFDPAKPEANVDDPDLMLQAFLASV